MGKTAFARVRWATSHAGSGPLPSLPWAILEPIVRAGEVFTWARDCTEADARRRWFNPPPGQNFVAVQPGTDGSAEQVVGAGELHANQGGGGSHVANAGYMVHPDYAGRGLARALCAYSLDAARADGSRAMQFNAVVESNTRAVAAWQAMGFAILATIPEAFHHPRLGYVGLHLMYRLL